jgi:hypothetical protein
MTGHAELFKLRAYLSFYSDRMLAPAVLTWYVHGV